MGFHRGLSSESYDRIYSNKTLLRRIWAYTHPYKKQLIIILLVVIIQAITGALPPLLVSRVLDTTLTDSSALNIFILLVSAVIVIEVLGYLFFYILRRLMVRVIGYVIRDLNLDAKVSGILGYYASCELDAFFTDRTGMFIGASHEDFQHDLSLKYYNQQADIALSTGTVLRTGITTRF